MKSLFVTAFAVTLSFSTLSIAATPAKKNAASWNLEPTSFMGLRFDQKVDDVLPLCPPRTQPRSERCHEEPYNNLYMVAMGPDIGFSYGLSVFAGGEGVESFYLTTSSDNYSSLAQLLTDKYGKPTGRSVETVKTKGGAEFNNETLTWTGKRVVIIATKYDGNINSSSASIMTVADSEKKAIEAAQKAKESAGKL